jgi:hypothetical protein
VPAIGIQGTGAPHSTEHEAIETELIARASHGHSLFREDNSSVYYKLEEATRATSYAASIKPYQRTKNGREAWLALSNQYAGNDKWEAEIKRHEQLLHTREWKGQSNFTLERFIAQHRNAFVSMQAAAEHVTYQLLNEHSRVGYLLDAIQCSDAGLQAAMASIKTDQDSKLLLPICYPMTRFRRRELIMLEASVALLTSQTQPARRQTFCLLVLRKAMDPLEFLFDTTPKQNMIC